VFGYLAVMRHLAGGSSAEDLGFTDQVIWNCVRGEWFRMSVYQGATWNTEIDLSRVAHPESLLAFHVEPMLLAFVPLYALGGGASLLLVIQAAVVGLGALCGCTGFGNNNGNGSGGFFSRFHRNNNVCDVGCAPDCGPVCAPGCGPCEGGPALGDPGAFAVPSAPLNGVPTVPFTPMPPAPQSVLPPLAPTPQPAVPTPATPSTTSRVRN
jgi:hypothetical protein